MVRIRARARCCHLLTFSGQFTPKTDNYVELLLGGWDSGGWCLLFSYYSFSSMGSKSAA